MNKLTLRGPAALLEQKVEAIYNLKSEVDSLHKRLEQRKLCLALTNCLP